ncbi:MAG TPA: allantoinase AllB [Bryobacteraceae bacterium]|jgi:allantoinase
MVDVLIRGKVDDIAIEDGKFTAIGPGLDLKAKREVDARELLILPGVIDVHVHFNEPGREHWEGASTGSRAFAAGGGTLYFDMPLNSTPCTVGVDEFAEKRARLQQTSVTDFGLWGGIIPGNRSALAELAGLGAIGFKAFMSDSGLPEFPRSDDLTLYEAMVEASKLDLPIAVHAENDEITRELSRRAQAEGRTGIRDYLNSRPVIAEVEAITRASLLAREAKAKLHIVHISSGRGVAAALEARALGTDISIETCAHYLFFTDEDMERIGAAAKCAPPLRPSADRADLFTRLRAGEIDIVASDHSPAPLEMKQDANFFKVWGGIAGVQSTLAVLLNTDRLPAEAIARLLSANPAKRFRIPHKGAIAVGNDADLVLIDPTAEYKLQATDLHQRHAISPYIGSRFRGAVRQTFVRGIDAPQHPRGRFVRPA